MWFLDPLVVTYGEEINKWVKVSLDGDDSETGTVLVFAKKYVATSNFLRHTPWNCYWVRHIL